MMIWPKESLLRERSPSADGVSLCSAKLLCWPSETYGRATSERHRNGLMNITQIISRGLLWLLNWSNLSLSNVFFFVASKHDVPLLPAFPVEKPSVVDVAVVGDVYFPEAVERSKENGMNKH